MFTLYFLFSIISNYLKNVTSCFEYLFSYIRTKFNRFLLTAYGHFLALFLRFGGMFDPDLINYDEIHYDTANVCSAEHACPYIVHLPMRTVTLDSLKLVLRRVGSVIETYESNSAQKTKQVCHA